VPSIHLRGAIAFAGLALFPAQGETAGKALAYLQSISGMHTVAGAHNDQKTGGVSYYTDRVKAGTGRYPGLWGGDFSYDAARVGNRWNMVYEAERQWNAGALVNLMWHACPPTGGEPCDWEADIHSHLSDKQWADLITDGGALNKVWKARMDDIARYLKYLDDKGIEALFRPHHEMNQGHFWWGGRTGPDGTAALFRVTHDYLVKTKGLRNLVWTWDVQDLSWDWDLYNPGDAYWDVFALDVYSHGYTDSLYRSMLRIAGDKPIALGEVSHFPSPEILARQPRWTFAMGWAYLIYDDNTAGELSALFNGANVVSRDEMPGWDKLVALRRLEGPRLGGWDRGFDFRAGGMAFRHPREGAGIVLIAADGRLKASPPDAPR
jgi:mannan endo-1,4-beta-mannosidase